GPDANGRNAFTPFVIPRRLQPPAPQITAVLEGGVPRVSVLIGGSIPVTGVRLYRGANARLGRDVGSMTLVTAAVPNADPTLPTVIADPGATPSWQRVQYRAVAVTADDPDRAGAAVASEPSKAYALLVPPPQLP